MLETARLRLRPARLTDLEPLHAIFSDPRAMRYWDRPAFDDISMTLAFLRDLIAGGAHNVEYVIEHDGRCIGKAGMWRAPEIGYILHPDYWQQGFGHEALSAIIAEIRRQRPDLPCLTAELDPRNTGSWRLLTKLGFCHLRTEEKVFLYGGTEWCDSAYFERVFEARPQTP